MMETAESVQDLFRILLAYFSPADCSRVHLVYDYACGLYEFMANRTPEYLKALRLHVDALHHEGHTCHDGFSTHLSSEVSSSNTSAGESVNASFAKQKKNVLYMKAHNTIRHLSTLAVIANLKALHRQTKTSAALPSRPVWYKS